MLATIFVTIGFLFVVYGFTFYPDPVRLERVRTDRRGHPEEDPSCQPC